MKPFYTFCVVIYISNFVIGFFGNILVLIYLCESLKHSYNFNKSLAYILINLAVADMFTEIFGIIGVVLEYDLIKHPDGVVGDVFCKVLTTHTLTWSFTNVSVFTVVLLAWERYVAVTRFKSKAATASDKSKYIGYALGSFWILGPLAYSPYVPFQLLHPSNGCVETFPNQWSKYLIVLFDFIVFFISPTIFFIFAYTSILLALKKPPKDMSARRRKQFSYHKVRRKLTRTTMVIVFGFIICWGGAYILYTVKTIASLGSPSIDTAFEISLIFAYFASTSHPIIYSFRSRDFRKKIKTLLQDAKDINCVLQLLLCCHKKKIEPSMKPYTISSKSSEENIKIEEQVAPEVTEKDTIQFKQREIPK